MYKNDKLDLCKSQDIIDLYLLKRTQSNGVQRHGRQNVIR